MLESWNSILQDRFFKSRVDLGSARVPSLVPVSFAAFVGSPVVRGTHMNNPVEMTRKSTSRRDPAADRYFEPPRTADRSFFAKPADYFVEWQIGPATRT